MNFLSQGVFWVGCSVLSSLAVAVKAEDLPAPAGQVILTVNGSMARSNSPQGAVFDLAMLQSIGIVNFSTTTPWTTGVHSFTGVPLDQFLAFLGAKPNALLVKANNEYQIKVPSSDAVKDGPILAWSQDDKLFSVRDKGPLWLVYPFDANSDYQTEEIQARAVWQIVQIDLLP